MDPTDYTQWIERESAAFAAVIDAGSLDARVAGCPEWSLRELAWHLGNVQQMWTTTVLAGVDVMPDLGEEPPGPTDAVALAAWMRASTDGLLDALRSTAFDTPAWAWWKIDHTVGAIARHQVHEAAVHRWDAQSAVGAPEPFARTEADDGIDEFVWIARQFGEPAPVAFVATDSGQSISVADVPPLVTASAPASDLVLLLYRRISPDAVRVEGDRATLDAFLTAVD